MILPALIYPEPLKQANTKRVTARMYGAYKLLADFEDEFENIPGAHQVLKDRYGELPRYLW